MGIFSRLFGSNAQTRNHPENDFVSQVIRCVDEECNTMDCIGIDIIKNDAKVWLKKLRDNNSTDSNRGENPRTTALFVIAQTVCRHLASGQYHVYRGVLGAEGIGMQDVWEKTAERLLNAGALTKADIDTGRKNLRNDISHVG